MKIDKKGWKKFNFGEVCKNLNKAESDALLNRIDRYVGLEHIESGNLHIKNWGNVAEGTTFTKKFAKGQVLFGKRRAYLKKAAVADFDGICSGDILVFEADEKVIHKNLLPFLVSSERFFDHAVQTSAGSLSPRTKFQDLAKLEFLLPPLEQQAKLAELLWAGDEVVELYEISRLKLSTVLNAYCETEFNKADKLIELGELGSFYKGRGIAKGEVSKTGLPCIRYGELYNRHHNVVRNYYSFISEEVAEKSFPLQTNDILFAGSGETLTEIGKSAAIKDSGRIYAGSDTIVFRPKKMNGIFLGYFLNSRFVRAQLDRMGKGATIAHIYPNDLKSLRIQFIEYKKQNQIAEKIEEINTSIEKLQYQMIASKALQKQLINQIFGG